MKRIADLLQAAGGVCLMVAGFTVNQTVGLVVMSVVLVVAGVVASKPDGDD